MTPGSRGPLKTGQLRVYLWDGDLHASADEHVAVQPYICADLFLYLYLSLSSTWHTAYLCVSIGLRYGPILRL